MLMASMGHLCAHIPQPMQSFLRANGIRSLCHRGIWARKAQSRIWAVLHAKRRPTTPLLITGFGHFSFGNCAALEPSGLSMGAFCAKSAATAPGYALIRVDGMLLLQRAVMPYRAVFGAERTADAFVGYFICIYVPPAQPERYDLVPFAKLCGWPNLPAVTDTMQPSVLLMSHGLGSIALLFNYQWIQLPDALDVGFNLLNPGIQTQDTEQSHFNHTFPHLMCRRRSVRSVGSPFLPQPRAR